MDRPDETLSLAVVAESASGPFSSPPIVALTPPNAAPEAASTTVPAIRPRGPPAVGGIEVSGIGATSIDPVVAA